MTFSNYRAFWLAGQAWIPFFDFTSPQSVLRFRRVKDPTDTMKGAILMEDTQRNDTDELDCAVTVYDGAWMTCDMIEEDTEESS